MKTIKLIVLGAFALLLSTTGCIEDFTIRGNGIEATEGRITPYFEKVKSEGSFDVHITNGDEHEIVITAESNILPYIETDVNGGTLRLHIRGLHHIKNHLPMKVFITTPYLEGIKQSGSGIVTTGYFSSDDMDIIVSGSGSIETAVDAISVDALVSGSGSIFLSGDAVDADYTVSGSGTIDAHDLMIRDCEARISGSGNVRTSVERYLSAVISGSGNVYYNGSPAIETHISGSGNLIREN